MPFAGELTPFAETILLNFSLGHCHSQSRSNRLLELVFNAFRNEFISAKLWLLAATPFNTKSLCMKKLSAAWLILPASFLLIFHLTSFSQNIGIGTTTPKAR